MTRIYLYRKILYSYDKPPQDMLKVPLFLVTIMDIVSFSSFVFISYLLEHSSYYSN